MSLNATSYVAFSDELTKIAVAKMVGNLIRRGWKDLSPGATRGGGWLGKQTTWRRNLPIGPKAIFTGLTAASIPGVVSKKDPLGKKRSRAERGTDLSADIVGGLAGAGAMLRLPGKKLRLARGIIGGLGGSLLASRIATTPWRRSREKARQPVLSHGEKKQLMPQQGAK